MAPVLPTGACIHRHAGVNLQYHFFIWVKEKDTEGAHLVWDAAGFWHTGNDSHSSDDALYGGVIGGTRQLSKKRKAITETAFNKMI